VNPENRKRILALAVVFVVIAALTSATPAPCSGDEHAAKVKEAAAQSVRAGKVFDALKNGAWDVAFLAIEPVRAAEIAFTAPYVIIEGVYMVPVDSPLRSVGDVDRDGVRIAVNKASAYDLFLTRTLKHARLVRGENGIELFLKDKLEAAAGVKQPLVEFAKTNPNVRIMDGRFMEIRQAMGTPKQRYRGREAVPRYLHAFVEEMKASGFVAKALERSNQPDAMVAPAA